MHSTDTLETTADPLLKKSPIQKEKVPLKALTARSWKQFHWKYERIKINGGLSSSRPWKDIGSWASFFFRAWLANQRLEASHGSQSLLVTSPTTTSCLAQTVLGFDTWSYQSYRYFTYGGICEARCSTENPPNTIITVNGIVSVRRETLTFDQLMTGIARLTRQRDFR